MMDQTDAGPVVLCQHISGSMFVVQSKPYQHVQVNAIFCDKPKDKYCHPAESCSSKPRLLSVYKRDVTWVVDSLPDS